MLDFKLVFRKDSNQNATPSDRSRKNKNDLEIYTFRDFMNQMQQEKSYMPPVRVLFAGDD